ncbi:MFS general substrate transporter [Favolaschia claudopus]|uniref:MFS general substrate transporter n=1 Tax=Favolaschia claudopus TaxID=2862362 RepID=A0AAW0DSX9_9AGAR
MTTEKLDTVSSLVTVEEPIKSVQASPGSTSVHHIQRAGGLWADTISYPDGGLRAWLIVFGSFFSVFSSFGYVNSWGVFQAYYEVQLLKGNNSSAMYLIRGNLTPIPDSMAHEICLTFGLAIFMGRLFDNGWFALPAACASLSLITLTILTDECTEYWHFLLCQGFGVGISTGIIFGPTLPVVSHWFKRRRSTALGIVAAGGSVGGLLIPIMVQNLIPRIGFRWTMRVLALLFLFTTGIMNLSMKRRLPPVQTGGGIFNWKAFKFPPFALYTFSVFVCFFGLYTLLTYIDISATSAGLDPSFDVYLLAFANAASGGCISVMIPGTLLAAVVTYIWPFVTTLPALIAVAVIYGFASGVFVGLQAVPLMHMGDMPDVGRRTGTLFSVLSLSALAGPPISGAIASRTGGYEAVGFYAGSTMMVALGILWYVRYLMTGKLFGGKF